MELRKIIEAKDLEGQFLKYEGFYKRRLIWNTLSISLSGLFFILTIKNMFFYLLIIQLLLSLLFYPRKILISKELNNDNIVYT